MARMSGSAKSGPIAAPYWWVRVAFMVKDQPVRVAFAAAGDPSNLLLFVYFDELFVHVVVALLPFALFLMIVIVVTFGVRSARW